MNRELIPTAAFSRAVRRYLRRHPQSANKIGEVLETLENDAFTPRLRTHKLKGDLSGIWACSVGYDLRILFEFVDGENGEAILLLSFGDHDSVY
jgi:addiction module RelE/StbE family toxin